VATQIHRLASEEHADWRALLPACCTAGWLWKYARWLWLLFTMHTAVFTFYYVHRCVYFLATFFTNGKYYSKEGNVYGCSNY
jgi:hypothetical protein